MKHIDVRIEWDQKITLKKQNIEDALKALYVRCNFTVTELPGQHNTLAEDVRLWIAKVRERLEHIHRHPITQQDGHDLLQESIDIAQRFNCYESNNEQGEKEAT